ncbi:cysteine desulfurase [Thalassobacillus devorans]|uniref:Cysteine desulfurase n=1 Tax=Thalassobacillus devorans TaxID=279813 RepID=A0ABQ1PNI4_9BACI|nr:IscS subfamily cysteine desulfurase [Thalassobacillus devorans]NIK30474.1 cysteine desulfurase [Thalassobacillus devorans]GGD00005.1 cysteine desulfurase [Thalassobacillus devorans]
MRYFDYAATCPIDDTALKIYQDVSQDYFGNTESLHDEGTKAGTLLEHCREILADTIGVDSEGLYFTSGGTESNHLGIRSLAKAGEGKHIISSQAEHSSVHHALEMLEKDGFEITKIPFTKEGFVDMYALEKAIRNDSVLVTIQMMNGEIGTFQPIEEISRICRKYGIYFHSDCVQALGKIDMKEYTPLLDGFSLSSHKIYGPKGAGAVYLSPSVPLPSDVRYGAHEKGIRSGTVNLPGISAFTAASQENIHQLSVHQEHFRRLRHLFRQALLPVHDRIKILGKTAADSAIIGVLIPGMEGQWTMLEANRRGCAISTGSACSIHQQSPSKTLLAMGYSKEEAKTFIRISFGKHTTADDVAALGVCLKEVMDARQTTPSVKV